MFNANDSRLNGASNTYVWYTLKRHELNHKKLSIMIIYNSIRIFASIFSA